MIKEWLDNYNLKRQQGLLPVSLGEHRIYILPTAQGGVFFAVLFAMLLGSINFNDNLGFIFTFLLSSMTFISLIHTHRNLAGISVQSVQISPVFAGEKAQVVVTLKTNNQSRHGIHLSFRGQEDIQKTLHGTIHHISVPIITRHRGECVSEPMTVSTSYPMGLFRAWSTVQPHISYLVYPKPLFGPFQPGLGTRESENEGATEIKGSDDFKELRVYQPGDTLSRLAWKSFAKGRGLHTKEFSTPAGDVMMLSWGMIIQPDVEIKLSRLCDMVQHAHRMNFSYGLSVPGTDIPPGEPKDPGHYHQCMKTLALFPKKVT